MLYTRLACLVVSAVLALAGPAAAHGRHRLTDEQRIGKILFFDENLSEPRGQSCASCHGPSVGFTGPVEVINSTIAVYPGAVPTRFGNRKPPTTAYAASAPIFSLDPATGSFTGGNFWDGSATGEKLGNPAADQAQGPFLVLKDRDALVQIGLRGAGALVQDEDGPVGPHRHRVPNPRQAMFAAGASR